MPKSVWEKAGDEARARIEQAADYVVDTAKYVEATMEEGNRFTAGKVEIIQMDERAFCRRCRGCVRGLFGACSDHDRRRSSPRRKDGAAHQPPRYRSVESLR